MAVNISGYLDPGVYIQEVIVPGALSIATVPFRPVVIAHGSRARRAINEAITRALIEDEALTVAGSSPHTATLAELGDRRVQNTTVYADDAVLPDAAISFRAAVITGTLAGPFGAIPGPTGSTQAITIELDGKIPVHMIFNDSGGATTVSVVGAQITVGYNFAASATRADFAAAINAGLNAASALGYGAAYANVASDATTGIRITSPISTAASHVKVSPCIATGTSITATIFGAATLETETVVQIADAHYDAAAVYSIDYIAVYDKQDGLEQDDVLDVLKVGSFHNVGNFVEDVSWSEAVPVSDIVIDWNNTDAAGVITRATHVSAVAENYALPASPANIRLSIDGKAAVTFDLRSVALTSPAVLGYAPAGASAAAADIANNINAVLAADAAYGARYNAVADTVTVGSSVYLRLRSPNDTTSSSIAILQPTTGNNATQAVFGLVSPQTLTVTGIGTRPSVGSVYFVTYEYERPASDYNTPRTFFTPDSAWAQVGPVASDNPLAIATDIAFRNGASSLMLIQVDDETSPGSPTRQEYLDALDAAATRSTATDIIILSTALETQTDLMEHVETQSSITEKNYRRGWFGMARGTAVGDVDTPDSYVFRAAQTLQVAADSPARGRLILVSSPGPEGINKTIVLEDGSSEVLELDSTYLAVACAARLSSFASPADALVRKNIGGFDVSEDDFTPWLRAERGLLASQGTTVVTFDAGRLVLLDPITTEAGGGGLISFAQISTSTQKDNLTRKIDAALDSNIVGIVPTDLASFIIDIKLVIMNVINAEIGAGSIGPYRDENGATRPLDPIQDIVVEQSATNQTQFSFKYFFSLRYPALRLLGEYSVDNPFFSV